MAEPGDAAVPENDDLVEQVSDETLSPPTARLVLGAGARSLWSTCSMLA